MVIQGYALSFDDEKLFCGYQQNCLVAKILISTHGIFFYRETSKGFPYLLPNVHLIYTTFSHESLYIFTGLSRKEKKTDHNLL